MQLLYKYGAGHDLPTELKVICIYYAAGRSNPSPLSDIVSVTFQGKQVVYSRQVKVHLLKRSQKRHTFHRHTLNLSLLRVWVRDYYLNEYTDLIG